ncbi:MAG: putative peptidoglycan glycosyltransferase FtsW, partial [Actinomycetes bacterium]
TLVPGIGTKVNGQTNWLSLGGPFQLQPSEFAKYALILWIAQVLSSRSDRVDSWRTLLLPIAPVSGVFLFLILAEGDLGTCLVIMPIITGMLLVGGAPKKLFGWIGISAVAVVLLMSIAAPYRLARFSSWLDPGAAADGAGYQVIHGQYALATGGWWGVGLGASREKWGFLPEAQTDFIFSVIGEELGLVGTLSILGLFVALAVVIFHIAQRTDDLFVRLATTGFGVWIVAQAIINIGTVLGLLPVTGLPLPLVSYGGSSLMFTLMAIGTLLAFARTQPAAREFLLERSNAKKSADARRTRRRPTRRPRSSERNEQRRSPKATGKIDLTDPPSAKSRAVPRSSGAAGRTNRTAGKTRRSRSGDRQ